MSGYSSRHLTWVRNGSAWVVRHGRTKLAFVVPDDRYAKMWRVRSADGPLSDIVNLTRTKDAAETIALAVLNRSGEAPRCAVPGVDKGAPQPRNRKPGVRVPADTARALEAVP